LVFSYYITFAKRLPHAAEIYKKFFLIICFGFPSIVVLVLLILQLIIQDVIVDVQIWCWINQKYPVMRFIFFYFWLILCIIINLIVYVKIFKFLASNKHVPPKIINVIKIQFILYLITFFTAWTAAVINRIYEWCNPNSASTVLTIIQAFCEPSQGWLLLLTYCFITKKYSKVDSSITVPLNHGYNEINEEE